ncbi:hypothetical protein [Massilia sp. YIM B04103]|uniref:hypothetical protein n=1 Tax=Massilia sp. YIM B04103 TaxID=2963106 RepID=UPI00210D44B5|nr:hypothetical protein [Massilia sp. YIM B04103]
MKKIKLLPIASVFLCQHTQAADAGAMENARKALEGALVAQEASLRALKAAYTSLNEPGSEAQVNAMKAAEAAAADARIAAEAVRPLVEITASAQVPKQSPMVQAPPAKSLDLQSNAKSVPTIAGMIKAGQANSTASLSVTLPNYGNEENVGKNRFQQFTLSAPVGKTSGPTKLGTLDGLADSAKIQYSFTQRQISDLDRPDGASWAFGLAPEVGSKKFTYNDASTYTEKEVTRTPYGLTLGASYQFGESLPLLFARYAFQRKYEDSKSKVLCRPNAEVIECIQGPVGEPQRKTSRILTMGARYQGGWYALNPTINYDHVSKVKGVDLPIYLFGASEKKPSALSGGIGAGWRSDNHDFTFYVFVGSPLEFWSLW